MKLWDVVVNFYEPKLDSVIMNMYLKIFLHVQTFNRKDWDTFIAAFKEIITCISSLG